MLRWTTDIRRWTTDIGQNVVYRCFCSLSCKHISHSGLHAFFMHLKYLHIYFNVQFCTGQKQWKIYQNTQIKTDTSWMQSTKGKTLQRYVELNPCIDCALINYPKLWQENVCNPPLTVSNLFSLSTKDTARLRAAIIWSTFKILNFARNVYKNSRSQPK